MRGMGSEILSFILSIPISMVSAKGTPFKIFQSGRVIKIEELIFESFCKSCIKGIIKSSIIPSSVQNMFRKESHISIDMVVIEHFEAFESSFRGLFNVDLSE